MVLRHSQCEVNRLPVQLMCCISIFKLIGPTNGGMLASPGCAAHTMPFNLFKICSILTRKYFKSEANLVEKVKSLDPFKHSQSSSKANHAVGENTLKYISPV